MPIHYARSLTSHSRSSRTDKHLGLALAFVAGAANAGAFLAVQRYTSHMTGIVSSMADDIVLGEFGLALGALGALLSFLAGAMVSTLMINFARRHALRSRYALPLLLEAALFLLFGLLGASLSTLKGLFVPMTVMLLCFTMGLQNAVITKLSGSVIRTTHLTGVITDLGIELGKLVYWNRASEHDEHAVVADRARLATLAMLCLFFLVGGILGAFGFKHIGYLATVPLAGILIFLSAIPVLDDLRRA
ncbi:YoaK family protein [Denitromonas ohlonensis]|jgi:uncharacterized membrane protein YoaK (UPF0700 family)|uniref:DUF1275 domain-containing protein n=2 Tax=Denitromonas TaxID=139331 RepID=A0A557SBJ8_9RHOO|nr:YoaK family protein [Denitromonas ohlonensis]TVO68496.1 DUF1275 domain-containing protein [Denitromonas ohlonensis]TVO74774.1 DUF1275 domain-containing protein [Denitromonas ohlonensis]TVT51163.1 MAG: DUF1275 domain-containing protein [Denitromonas halophila]TVT71312.1 MAG: DUF1275 domain-containing protein [Denitromonas halophila]